MSRTRYTLPFDLHNMVPGPASKAAVQIIYNSEDGIMLAYGDTVPAAASGYASGCVFIHNDGSAGSMLYANDGNATTSNFEVIGTPNNVDVLMADGTNIEDAITTAYPNATAAGGSGPSPLLWDDVPLLDLSLDPSKGYVLFEDFNAMLTQAEVAATLTQNTGSGTFTDDPTVAGGVGVLDNAANTANLATTIQFLAMQCKPGVGTHIVFEARVKVGVDDGGVFIGMADDASTDPLASGTIVTNADHAVFFRDTGTGAAAMGTQACDGSGITTSDTTITDVDITAYETFGIHIFGDGDTAGDYVKFYHEGVLVATATDADGGGNDGVPDAVICPTFQVDNIGDTTQQLLKIDWMRVACYNATAGTVRV